MGPTATILHADLDAFYASVEQLLDPRLRGKPIAVGGGVVLAASYEARAFGVRSGMPGRRARQLCPDLVFVGGHFDEYQRLGDAAIGVLSDFTPSIERISIDEAFADVAGCTHLFGSPADIAKTVRARVRAELGLPISIGVARTKHLAKVASQVAKPDGLVVVDPDTELEFLHELPVALMWGVGPATEARLAEIGVTTIGQLAESSPQSVERLLGHAVGKKVDGHSRGTAIRGKSRRAGARTPPAHNRRSDDSLQSSASSNRRSIISPTASAPGSAPNPWPAGRSRSACASPTCARSRARSRCRHRFLQRGLSLRSPRTWCAAPLRITVTRRRSRCWRSPSHISKRVRSCNWSCRSGLPTKDAALGPRTAWRDRAQTKPSMRSASASEDKRWIMGRYRGSGAPSLTSSVDLLKGNSESTSEACFLVNSDVRCL